jgi:peptide deformylase
LSLIYSLEVSPPEMARRPLIHVDNPLLREKSKKVRQFTPSLRVLINDMVDTMHEEHGIGLAAPQIGVLQRIIVAELPEDEEDPQSGKLFAIVNPEIVKAAGEAEGQEGCLSIPTWYGLVKRATSVVIKGQDARGKPTRVKAEGTLARVLQHEIDHLNGVLFIDLVESPDQIWQVIPEEQDKELALPG